MNLGTAGSAFPFTGNLIPGKDYGVINLIPLAQQEAITFLPDGKSFIYSSESVSGRDRSGDMMQVDCQD